MSERTVRRWLESPGFAAELQRAQDRAFGESLDALRRLAGKALAVADRNMRPGRPADVQLSAARLVLGLALRAHDAVRVEERLSAFEARTGLGAA